MPRIAMIGHGTTHNSPEEQIFNEALKCLLATASSRAISRSSPDANLALIVSDATPQPESSILSRLIANPDQCPSMFEVMYMLALYDIPSPPASPEAPNGLSSLNFSIVSYREEAAKQSRSSYHYPTQHQRDSIATSDHRTTPPPTKRRNFYRKG